MTCDTLVPEPMSADPFVGRQDLLDVLGRLLERPGLVLLVGPPGVGKSRLCREALMLTTRAHQVIDLRAMPDSDWLRYVASEERESAGDTQLVRRNIVLRCGAAPRLIVLENAQGDALRPDDVDFVIGHMPQATLVLIARVEPTVSSPMKTVRVGPLTQADARTLLEHRVPLRDSELDRLAMCSGGLPLAIELLARWVERLGVESIASALEVSAAVAMEPLVELIRMELKTLAPNTVWFLLAWGLTGECGHSSFDWAPRSAEDAARALDQLAAHGLCTNEDRMRPIPLIAEAAHRTFPEESLAVAKWFVAELARKMARGATERQSEYCKRVEPFAGAAHRALGLFAGNDIQADSANERDAESVAWGLKVLATERGDGHTTLTTLRALARRMTSVRLGVATAGLQISFGKAPDPDLFSRVQQGLLLMPSALQSHAQIVLCRAEMLDEEYQNVAARLARVADVLQTLPEDWEAWELRCDHQLQCANFMLRQGALAEAYQHAEEAARLGRTTGLAAAEVYALWLSAAVKATQNQTSEASELSERAAALAERKGVRTLGIGIAVIACVGVLTVDPRQLLLYRPRWIAEFWGTGNAEATNSVWHLVVAALMVSAERGALIAEMSRLTDGGPLIRFSQRTCPLVVFALAHNVVGDTAAAHELIGTAQQFAKNPFEQFCVGRARQIIGGSYQQVVPACGAGWLEEIVLTRVLDRLQTEGTHHTLSISGDCQWYQLDDGPRVWLSRRPTLMRVLSVLVGSSTTGATLSASQIFAGAWPREKATPRSAGQRVRTAISELRTSGLAPVLGGGVDGTYRIAARLVRVAGSAPK